MGLFLFADGLHRLAGRRDQSVGSHTPKLWTQPTIFSIKYAILNVLWLEERSDARPHPPAAKVSKPIMDANGLILATTMGSVLQQAMVWTGHFIGSVRPRVFAIGGTGLSFVSGGLYAMLAAGGWRDAVLGGAIAGGLSACMGMGTSVALGDTPPTLLLPGAPGATVAGGLGAILAHLVG